jgi:hypothetical protein
MDGDADAVPPVSRRPHVHAIEAGEMDGGHDMTLSRPRELAERLRAYATSLA